MSLCKKCKLINLIGQRFGRLIVLARSENNKWSEAQWLCRCDCGSEKVIVGSSLKNGLTQSCGCLQKERASEANRGENNNMYGRKRGKNNPTYNPLLTDEDRLSRRLFPGYTEWRQQVYKRDDWTCQCCGTKKSPFNAHHIEGYNNNPKLRIELSNGITLCEDCHSNFHHQYGRGNNTRNQLEKFLRECK